MQRRANYTPRPSLEIARYRSMPLPPEPCEIIQHQVNALGGYRDWENRQKSSSYESLTGQSLLSYPVDDSSFYEGTTLLQDFDRISQYSTYSDVTAVGPSFLSRSDSLDTIAEQADHSHLAHQSRLPAVPDHMLTAVVFTTPVDCRLSSASTTAPDSPRLAKRLLKRSATPEFFSSKNLDTFQVTERPESFSGRTVTPVPSLSRTHSLASFDEPTPSSRQHCGTITIMHSPTIELAADAKTKPKPIFTAGTRNISSPMPSPIMNNDNYNFTSNPTTTDNHGVDIAYQPSRSAPMVPFPNMERSHFDTDSDDEPRNVLTRMKKSIPDFKTHNRSKANLSGRTAKKTNFADPLETQSMPSPPLPPPATESKQVPSNFVSPPRPQSNKSHVSCDAGGRYSSMLSRSPTKLSKKSSVKQERHRAGTTRSQASTTGKTSMSTGDATLVGTVSSSPVVGANSSSLSERKKRFSLAVSTKSGKKGWRGVSLGKLKRWAMRVLRC